MKNLISVIINFHNGEKYLKNSVKSVIEQNYKNFELILWDNASTDNSKLIISNFEDNRIKYFRNPIKDDLYKARNKALSHSEGKFIAFLDCDDWWEKDYLSSREQFFEDENFDFYYCNANYFFEKKRKKKLYKNYTLPSGRIYSSLSKDYFIIISGVIFRKELFQKFGKFNENYNIIGDFDFIMKISSFSNAHALNLPLINYRVHDENFSKLNNKIFYEEYKSWFEENKKKLKNFDFKENIFLHENRLHFLEISFLLKNSKKNFGIFKKIIKHNNFIEKVKFLILFFSPKGIHKFIRK